MRPHLIINLINALSQHYLKDVQKYPFYQHDWRKLYCLGIGKRRWSWGFKKHLLFSGSWLLSQNNEQSCRFFIFESSSCKWSEALILLEERQQRGGMQSRILILFSASAWLLIQHQSDKKLKKFTIHTTICTVRDDFFCCLFSASSHGQVIWILCVLFSSLRFPPP